MYPVSQEYIAVMQAGTAIRRSLTGRIGGVNFTGDDILVSSFSYSGRIVSSTDVKLGGVFIQTVKFSFLKSFSDNIPRGTWKGRKVEVSIGLWIEAEQEYEYVPLGEFIIDDAMHSAVGVDITAYCNMSKFDTSSGLAGTMNGTLYEIASLACYNCGVTLGMTAADFAELPNGTGVFSPYEPNDIENWHDVISWIASTVCGYATIDREGRLVFRTWSDVSVMDISGDIRFDDGLYSDFETYYTGISLVNMQTQKTEYLGLPVDDGLTMNLGSNPFLQYGIEEVRTARKQAILDGLQKFRYVPFSVSTFLDPSFDLGDVLTFTGGRAANSKCCVMSIEYSFNAGLKLAGYGNDPALANARSKVDKNLAGLLGQTDEKTMRYYTFVNPNAIEDITDETIIGSFFFATVETTTVTMWHEIQAEFTLDDETEPMQAIVHYYLNGVEEGYTPVMTIGESGVHTFDFNYFLLGIAGGLRNEWTVELECIGGTADIDRNGVHICLQGQGLVGEEAFLGIIEVSEEMPLFVVSAIEAGAFTDTVTLTINNCEPIVVSDSFVMPTVEPIISPSMTEAVTLALEIDESLVMRCGDEFYAGDDFATGMYNTLYEEGE